MPVTIGLRYAVGLSPMGDRARETLAALWSGRIRWQPLEQRPVPSDAYDTARRHVDVRFLLDATVMPLPPGCDAVLWFVGEDIGDCWRPWILGAAGPQRAVVSTFRLPHPLAVLKIAAHELGHLLGLAHCPAACCMRPVRHASQLAELPLSLCRGCRRRLLSARVEGSAA